MTFRVNQIQSDKQSKFFRFCVVEVWECVENEADTKTKVSKYKFIRIYKQTNIPILHCVIPDSVLLTSLIRQLYL